MTVSYPVIFTRTGDEKDTYLIEIPDINGMTEGFGQNDAIHMARDYIGSYFLNTKEEDAPRQSSIADIDPKKGQFADEGESFVSLVDCDVTDYRKKNDTRVIRRSVSLPNWLNNEAQKAHINVSKTLQRAIQEELGLV